MSKTVVITGSSRGIGLGLAAEFLKRGHRVVVHGRTDESVAHAKSVLAEYGPEGQIASRAGLVSDPTAMQTLWDSATAQFGRVDIWINNAGLGHNMQPAWELPLERIAAVLDGNILGLVVSARVAVRGMLQQGFGQIYNMEGFGADGRLRRGMSIYGTSKAAVAYFSRALIAETAGTAVQVGTLRPGMVITDLLLDPLAADPAIMARSQRIFNILADRVETITPWLADRILTNRKHGRAIKWLTTPKILWRFATAPFNKRDLFSPET